MSIHVSKDTARRYVGEKEKEDHLSEEHQLALSLPTKAESNQAVVSVPF